MEIKNPFEFDAAANLPLDLVKKIYIEDHNNSRFILSNRNVFLLGERGSGKSMMLIYNSFKLSNSRLEEEQADFLYKFVGVHVPCKRPLFSKIDYELFDHNMAAMVSEHYLVMTILHSLASELEVSDKVVSGLNLGEFLIDFEYIVGERLPDKSNVLTALKLFAQRQVNIVEKIRIHTNEELKFINLYSFQSLIVPVIELLKNTEILSDSHFMIMIDDAHDLNHFQIKKINSWISYRDHSNFSLKVATADVYKHSMQTDFGGCIVEGHDFMSINMEKSFQNPLSPFHRLAKDIIDRRLELLSPDLTAETFFPINKTFEKDLLNSKASVKQEFVSKKPDASEKQISDYIYKNHRVAYFRNRSAKANRPPYSGFEILVQTSTGVIRNLLVPCFSMFDRALSESKKIPDFISPRIQQETLLEQSDRMWAKLRNHSLSDELMECNDEMAGAVHNFFEALGDLFTERLKSHKSEPRVITFSISGLSDELKNEIEPLFSIARKSLLLYERSGPAKDSGRRETFYVPNRMLWIARGLDPVGQHGRVSIPAKDIVASFKGNKFPVVDVQHDKKSQQELSFDE